MEQTVVPRWQDTYGSDLDGVESDPSLGLLTEDEHAILADLQQEEVLLAVTIYDCGGTDDARTELYDELRAEYETEFIDANRERLETFLVE